MEKKYQIYLASFLMYVIAGFAGYVYQASSYWIVALLTILATLFMVSCFLGLDQETKQNTKIQWISAFAFAGVELGLTVCVELVKLPFTSVFKYVNYAIQILGFLFVIYLVAYIVISYTHINEKIIERIKNKKTVKTEVLESEQSDVAVQVEETIKEETPVNEEENPMEDVEVVGETKDEEPEVLGIEFKEEDEIETPYMEEEF